MSRDGGFPSTCYVMGEAHCLDTQGGFMAFKTPDDAKAGALEGGPIARG